MSVQTPSPPPLPPASSPACEVLSLSLSFPPSANAIWRNVGGRTLVSAPYRRWKTLAFMEITEQGLGRLRRKTLPGPYQMTLLADRPDNRRRDLANLEKAISDALTQAGVIEDDHWAQRITLAWSNRPAGKDAKIWVTLESYHAPG